MHLKLQTYFFDWALKMIYEYSSINRLKIPNTYMYSRYEGNIFLQKYLNDRLEKIKTINIIKSSKCPVSLEDHDILKSILSNNIINHYDISFESKKLEFVYKYINEIKTYYEVNNKEKIEKKTKIEFYNQSNKIITLQLLHHIIDCLLATKKTTNMQKWINILIKKFEVTKKIYESYDADFRKGNGTHLNVRIYWFFAVSLFLYYAKTFDIKYLSTMLKIDDLLTSLPEEELQKSIPKFGLQFILSVELIQVISLANLKKVSF